MLGNFLGSLRLNALLVSIALLLPLGATAAECKKVATVPIGSGVSKSEVDQVWSGTRVSYAATGVDDDIYLGYYDSSRRFTVAKYARKDRTLCTAKLDSTFGGWDSHNSVVVAVDRMGYVHVAGNMHASPLVYARSERPGSIEGLHLTSMVGKNEEFTTYPTFVPMRDGSLLFLYREGKSGDGQWILNRWMDGKWQRVQDELFGRRWKKQAVSAYPSWTQGADGTFHVAIVWRSRPDAAANVVLSYVNTADFKTWRTSTGKVVQLPITPDTAEVVESPGEGAGLLNSEKVSLDPSGQPVITYTKYAADGSNGIFAARPAGSSWKINLIAKADRQTPVAGAGSLPDVPRFRNLDFGKDGRTASIDIGFSGQATKRYSISPDTLQPFGPPGNIEVSPDLKTRMPPIAGLADQYESTVVVEWPNQEAQPGRTASLHYITQATNRDQPRLCTPQAAKACAPPPSPLNYVEYASGEDGP